MSRTRKAEPKSHTTRLRRAPGSPGLGKPTLGIANAIVTPCSARGARAQALLRRAARPDRCARRGCAGLRKADDTNPAQPRRAQRSEEHTSELQSQSNLVCRLLLEKKKKKQ